MAKEWKWRDGCEHGLETVAIQNLILAELLQAYRIRVGNKCIISHVKIGN